VTEITENLKKEIKLRTSLPPCIAASIFDILYVSVNGVRNILIITGESAGITSFLQHPSHHRRYIALGLEDVQGSDIHAPESEVFLNGEVFAKELLEGDHAAALETSDELTILTIGEIQTVIMKLGIDELSH